MSQLRKLPPKRKPNQPLFAAEYNLLIDALRLRTPLPVPGMELVETSEGWYYRPPGKAVQTLEYTPWKPRWRKDGENIFFKVDLGSVSGMIADNWDDEFAAPSSGWEFLVVTLTAQNGGVTGLTMSLDSEAPSGQSVSQGAPPEEYSFPVTVISAGKYLPIWQSNLSAAPAEAFLESRTGTAPGEEPFTRWYNWVISGA
jgi:hypothetical protein